MTTYTPEIMKSIRERDNHKCRNCGVLCHVNPYDGWYYPNSEYNLDVHHIDHDRKNNNPKNLILLCTRCHNKIGRYKPKSKFRPRDNDGYVEYYKNMVRGILKPNRYYRKEYGIEEKNDRRNCIPYTKEEIEIRKHKRILFVGSWRKQCEEQEQQRRYNILSHLSISDIEWVYKKLCEMKQEQKVNQHVHM